MDTRVRVQHRAAKRRATVAALLLHRVRRRSARLNLPAAAAALAVSSARPPLPVPEPRRRRMTRGLTVDVNLAPPTESPAHSPRPCIRIH